MGSALAVVTRVAVVVIAATAARHAAERGGAAHARAAHVGVRGRAGARTIRTTAMAVAAAHIARAFARACARSTVAERTAIRHAIALAARADVRVCIVAMAIVDAIVRDRAARVQLGLALVRVAVAELARDAIRITRAACVRDANIAARAYARLTGRAAAAGPVAVLTAAVPVEPAHVRGALRRQRARASRRGPTGGAGRVALALQTNGRGVGVVAGRRVQRIVGDRGARRELGRAHAVAAEAARTGTVSIGSAGDSTIAGAACAAASGLADRISAGRAGTFAGICSAFAVAAACPGGASVVVAAVRAVRRDAAVALRVAQTGITHRAQARAGAGAIVVAVIRQRATWREQWRARLGTAVAIAVRLTVSIDTAAVGG